MADIQRRLEVDVNYASQYRRRLIAAELIEATGHGDVDSAIPYLREHLREHARLGHLTTPPPMLVGTAAPTPLGPHPQLLSQCLRR
jgi:hypothetical protein